MLVVMGVSGCGKSTLGASISKALECPFLEGDSFHAPEAIAKMQSGTPLTDEDRWPWLSRLGMAAAREVKMHGHVVVACSSLRHSYREKLRETIDACVRFVFLDLPREELLARVSARPEHYMPASLLDSQLETLERPNPSEGVLTITEQACPQELCQKVMDWLTNTSAPHPYPSG